MGKVMHDSETAAHGQQAITACAFIHRVVDGEEKLFLAQRAHTKKFLPGKWELPGGHIDFGEDITEGLKREIDEEFGVGIELGDPFAAFTYDNQIKGSHSIEVVYFARLLDAPEAIALEPEDHADAGWFTLEQALALNGDQDDAEKAVIKKGFALLGGERPHV